MKAYGHEIVDFYKNGWPKGHYVDDSIFQVTDDGRICKEDEGHRGGPGLPLDKQYEVGDFGAIIHEKTGDAYQFSCFFRRWKRDKTTVTLVVDVPREQEEAARKAISSLGYKLHA